MVTGASHGIGKTIAELFSEQGWQVINLSRSTCDLAGVINYSIDFSKKEWPANKLDDIHQHLKHATQICLVHNASWCQFDSVDECDIDKYRHALEINLVAPMRLNQFVIPFMKKESSIIYIGSTLSEKAVKNMATYVTSKHAIAGMMRATCQDLAGTGIHTCCVCPGFTNTNMLQNNIKRNLELIKKIKARVGDNRLIEPEEIASLVYFCANHPVINGSLLHAHLGQIEE